MSGVVGTHCVEFPQPTEPITYRPFFGKFATTGEAAAPGLLSEPETPAAAKKTNGSNHGKAAPRAGGGAPAAGTEPNGASPEHGNTGNGTPAPPTEAPHEAVPEPGPGAGGGGGAKTGGTAPPG